MNVELKGGETPGDTKPGVVFAVYLDFEKRQPAQSYPEEMVLSKFSETEDRVCYLLVSIQTEEDTVGLMDLLRALSDQSTEIVGRDN